MRQLTRSARRGGALTGLLAAMLLMLPGSAMAQDPPPDPAPGYEEFQGCPLITTPGGTKFCLRITATGQLGLGGVQADIDDPIDLVVGVRTGGISGDSPPEVYLAEGEGEADPIPVPGGLLGIPELDPITYGLAPELLGINARPNIGTPDADIENLVTCALVCVAFGISDPSQLVPPSNLGLPLDIGLENVLFGDDCSVGTAAQPIGIGLTTGTTEPPEGFEPMTGAYGTPIYDINGVHYDVEAWQTDPPVWSPGDVEIGRMLGSRFVGNAYDVPGASGCNTLGGLGFAGTPVETLVNLDSVISSQAGLPSPAGNNVADFNIDIAVAEHPSVYP